MMKCSCRNLYHQPPTRSSCSGKLLTHRPPSPTQERYILASKQRQSHYPDPHPPIPRMTITSTLVSMPWNWHSEEDFRSHHAISCTQAPFQFTKTYISPSPRDFAQGILHHCCRTVHISGSRHRATVQYTPRRDPYSIMYLDSFWLSCLPLLERIFT